MKGVEYSLDKTQHRIASNLQINNCSRHFSAVRTSCFSLKYQVFADSERAELRYFFNFFEDRSFENAVTFVARLYSR